MIVKAMVKGFANQFSVRCRRLLFFSCFSLFVYVYFDNLVSSTSHVIIFMSISITYKGSALLIQMWCSASFFVFYRAPYPVIPVSIIVSTSILSVNVYHNKFICHFLFNHRKPPLLLLLMLWLPRTPVRMLHKDLFVCNKFSN